MPRFLLKVLHFWGQNCKRVYLYSKSGYGQESGFITSQTWFVDVYGLSLPQRFCRNLYCTPTVALISLNSLSVEWKHILTYHAFILKPTNFLVKQYSAEPFKKIIVPEDLLPCRASLKPESNTPDSGSSVLSEY